MKDGIVEGGGLGRAGRWETEAAGRATVGKVELSRPIPEVFHLIEFLVFLSYIID